MCKLKIAEQQSGNEGYVTIESLKSEFNTEAWEDLDDEESTLYRFLNSSMFRNKAKLQKDEQIDSEILSLFALLHCPGKAQDRAEQLYQVLHEGHPSNGFTAASNKNMFRVFNKLCDLASHDLMKVCCQIEEHPQFYNDDELESMREAVDTVREEQLLESLYGARARLDDKEWIYKVSNQIKEVLNAKNLRARVLVTAQIEAIHFE